MRELHSLHMADEIPLGGVAAQPCVEGLLFGHGGDTPTGVVVAGIEHAGFRQRQQLLGDGVPEGVGIALLKVAAAATTYEQRITAEGHRLIIEHEAEAAIGMPRGGTDLQSAAAEVDAIPMGQGPADVLGAGGGGQADGTAGGLVHQPAAGHVIGMGMGVDRGHQLDAQFADQGEIATVLLEDRVDDHPLAAGHISKQIREGAGVGVEELAKEQRATTGGGREGQGGCGSDGHGCSITNMYEHSRIMGIKAISVVRVAACLRPLPCALRA